jgi:starch phosphorylase
MATLTPRFSADRAVRDYTEQHYLQGAAAYRARAANKGALGREIVDWQKAVEHAWPAVRFGAVRVETRDGQHFFEAEVYLSDLDPAAVRVELYADGGAPVRREMDRLGPNTYRAAVPALRPASDFTPRLIPRHHGVAVPLQMAHILWQR